MVENRFGFLERNLIGISLLALTIIGVLAGATLYLIQDAIDNQESDSRVVNIAGRQRMLSQRISKNAVLLSTTFAPSDQQRAADELADSLELWQQSHDGLRFGDDGLGLPGNNSDEVNRLFNNIQPNYEEMLAAGRCLAGLQGAIDAPASCTSRQPTIYTEVILANEADFLAGMNRIVFQYDEESNARVQDLDQLSLVLFGIILGVLLLEAFLVFIPIGIRVARTTTALTLSTQALAEGEAELRQSERSAQILNRNLQSVVELNSSVASILNVEQLLQDVVDLLKDRFGLYHAHIYLYDEQTGLLRLAAGAGYIGELMVAERRTIELANPESIVARAGRSFQSVVVNDVNIAPDFLPHPLLPDTQSEFAVALMARGGLAGVLDVQSEQRNFFTPDEVRIIELAASQVSTALSNALLFQAVQQASAHEQALGNINRSIEQASSVDDILQATVRELGKALRIPYAAIELQLDTTQSPDSNS